MLDCNFNFKTEGFIQIARALEPLKLTWLELDSYNPHSLRDVRNATTLPICSGENLYGTRGYHPFFKKYAMDVVSVDIIWNGLLQSKKIADMAELYEINVAPHNHYSHLAGLMAAHFCAAIPNFRILEMDVDDVPWKDEVEIMQSFEEMIHAVFVTVKAYDLERALKRMDRKKIGSAIVIPLLNGIEHMEILRKQYGGRVVAGTIGSVEVSSPEPGVVCHKALQPHITLAPRTTVLRRQLRCLRSVLVTAGMRVSLDGSEKETLWRKIVRLNALACTTARLGKPIGEIRSNPKWRKLLKRCVQEAVSVARAEQVILHTNEVMGFIDRLNPNQSTSLARDVKKRRNSELDALAGAIVRVGARHGIQCPTIKRLMREIESHLPSPTK